MKINKDALILSLFILGISIIVMFTGKISYLRFVDSWFIISFLFTAIFLFKAILDRGALYIFRYSWHKTKRHILFFLPRYWKTEDNNVYLAGDDGEKIKIDDIYDYINYSKSRTWGNMNVLLFTSFAHLGISVVLSLLIYFY